jgi:hypothetical protein
MAVPQVSKLKLSGSTDGQPIAVAAIVSPGTTIHTAQSGTVAGSYDEVWLWAVNTSAAACELTIQFGGTATSNAISVSLPAKSGNLLVCPGLVLQNSLLVKAYAAVASVINLSGYANRLTA